mgnify:CR=1 FL=1
MSEKSSPVLETHGHSGPVQRGSERSFGIVFAVVFAIVGSWPLKDGGDIRPWALALAIVFLIAALAAPRVLKPLNLLWFRFGLLPHKIMTPLIMGLLFFLTVTPVGLLMRATGKDPMRLRRDPAAASYWIVRDPPGPRPDSMKNQF